MTPRALILRLGTSAGLAAFLGVVPAEAAAPELVVAVTGPSKKPMKDVAVVVGVKSFPGGKFEYHVHEAKTDAKGRATFADVVPASGRYGVYAWVAEKGVAFVSAYQWQAKGGAPDPIALSTLPATPLRLRFVDDAQKPVQGVSVAPAMRADPSGVRHSWFRDAPASLVVESGADGLAEVSSFLPGEWVGVSVRFPGGEARQRTLLVPKERDAVVVVPSQEPATPEREMTVGTDARRAFIAIGPKPRDVQPTAGWGLVLVLPGGEGSVEARPWVRSRYDDWVDAGWLFVELVAPKWSGSENLVWPTAASKVTELPFTTEEFADGAVAEVEKSMKVDRRRVLAVSWSSSGPACWRMLTTKSSAVTGHLIAMSVFHPKDLEPLANGKQRPLFLLHSPDDKICPIALAEQGRDAARKAGLKVEWATYEGGHGWAGDSTETARRGLRWISDSLP